MFKKGYKPTEEHKKKISDAVKGMHRSPNTAFKKGHKHSPEVLEKIRQAMLKKVKKFYLWGGGKNEFSDKVRRTSKNAEWRGFVFERDNWTCTKCKKKGGILHAHHIKPLARILEENEINTSEKAFDCEELWNINNGSTMCPDCHERTDTYNGRWQ